MFPKKREVFLRILAGIKEEINEILEYMDACERDRINKGL